MPSLEEEEETGVPSLDRAEECEQTHDVFYRRSRHRVVSTDIPTFLGHTKNIISPDLANPLPFPTSSFPTTTPRKIESGPPSDVYSKYITLDPKLFLPIFSPHTGSANTT